MLSTIFKCKDAHLEALYGPTFTQRKDQADASTLVMNVYGPASGVPDGRLLFLGCRPLRWTHLRVRKDVRGP